MSLSKTAQLNVYELLKYLDHDNLKHSISEQKRLASVSGKRMMNLRPKQSWITGPVAGHVFKSKLDTTVDS